MDIVVKGRHTAVPDRLRNHVLAKLGKMERLDSNIIAVDVELSKEHNPRLSDVCERVELTVYSKGPVIRAEAAADDFYAALDRATAKLAERLRRAADRRVRHHANHAGAKPAGIRSIPMDSLMPLEGTRPMPADQADADDDLAPTAGGAASRPVVATPADGVPAEADGAARAAAHNGGPLVVREKTHEAEAMTLEDALSNMELVGHDFYLFLDVDLGLPSVVYRRVGYDYGVIRLTGSSVGGRPAATDVDQPAGRASREGSALASTAAAL